MSQRHSFVLSRFSVLGLLGTCFVGTLFWGDVDCQAQGPQRPPSYQSAVVEEGEGVFRIFAPDAEKVVLAGSDFPDASDKSLTKGENGVWEIKVALPAGAYRYNFNVDGVSTLDPVNPLTSQSNANTWSLLTVEGSDIFDVKDVPHGAVAEVFYQSKTLDRTRRMHVYTPPGYENGDQAYPVFYLLHGASDNDDSWTSVGRANFTLDNLIAEGKAVPMIVVMPDGHTGTFRWGGGGKPFDEQMKEFVDDFNNDVRPYIESHYRVKDGAENRAIAGLSMGGAQTLNVAIPDLADYGYFGVFSSGVFGIAGGFNREPNDEWEQANLKTLDDPALKKSLKLVWFGCGTEDFLVETSRATVKMLESHEFEVEDVETDGGHTWKNWRQYLPIFAGKLFK